MTIAFPTPSAGFDHPIEMLDDCHGRIRRECRLIELIAAHVRWGVNAEAAAAAAGVVRFFDTAGAAHHRDEEEDLFPALQHFAPALELNAVRDLVARLRKQHRRLDLLWQDMRARLLAVTAGDVVELTPEIAAEFTDEYDRHIALEEAELLPLARRILDRQCTERLGRRMAARRGVPASAG